MSVERQALHGLKWSGLAKLAGQLMSWAVTLLVIRLLVPADYGLMALASVIVAVVAGIGEMGLGGSIIQARAIDRDTLARLGGALALLNLGLGLLVVLIAPLAGSLLGNVRLVDVIRVLALQFVLNATITIPESMAYRAMNFKWLAMTDLGSTVVASLTTLALAWWGAGVWALVGGTLSGATVRAVILNLQGYAVRPVFRLSGIGAHLRYGGWFTASRMAWQIASQADILIAGRLLPHDAVGLYSVSLHLANLPMTKIMGIFNQVAFPTVARLQGDPARLRTRLLETSRLLSVMTVPVVWGLSAIAPEFIEVVLGSKWLHATFPLQAVSLVVPLRMITNILNTALYGIGQPKVATANIAVTCVVLPAAFLAGVHWGLDGLALAWIIAVPLLVLLNFPRTGRAIGLRARDLAAEVLPVLIAGAAMYAVVAATRFMLPNLSALHRLPVLVAAGAAVYVSALWVVDRRSWTDLKRIALALKV